MAPPVLHSSNCDGKRLRPDLRVLAGVIDLRSTTFPNHPFPLPPLTALEEAALNQELETLRGRRQRIWAARRGGQLRCDECQSGEIEWKGNWKENQLKLGFAAPRFQDRVHYDDLSVAGAQPEVEFTTNSDNEVDLVRALQDSEILTTRGTFSDGLDDYLNVTSVAGDAGDDSGWLATSKDCTVLQEEASGHSSLTSSLESFFDEETWSSNSTNISKLFTEEHDEETGTAHCEDTPELNWMVTDIKGAFFGIGEDAISDMFTDELQFKDHEKNAANKKDGEEFKDGGEDTDQIEHGDLAREGDEEDIEEVCLVG